MTKRALLYYLDYSELTPEIIKELGKVYWGPPDEKRCTIEDIDEAIAEILGLPDYHNQPPLPGVDKFVWPDMVEVVAVQPVQLRSDRVDPRAVLDEVLESLDEEYGDIEGDPTEPTDTMRRAAEVFCEVIIREYPVFRVEEVLQVHITDVPGWVKDHTPDWLNDPRR